MSATSPLHVCASPGCLRTTAELVCREHLPRPQSLLLQRIQRLPERVPCITCGGQGYIGDGGYVTCPVCAGSGMRRK